LPLTSVCGQISGDGRAPQCTLESCHGRRVRTVATPDGRHIVIVVCRSQGRVALGKNVESGAQIGVVTV
jgi:hypothetical protein